MGTDGTFPDFATAGTSSCDTTGGGGGAANTCAWSGARASCRFTFAPHDPQKFAVSCNDTPQFEQNIAAACSFSRYSV
jgi:hypothetical protein